MGTLFEDLQAQHKSLKGKLLKGAHRRFEPIPTGVPPVDSALGGGVPLHRVSEWFGRESSGKSLLAYLWLANVQRLGGTAVLIDSEGSYDDEYFASIGGVPEELIMPPDDQTDTVADVFQFVKMLCDTMEKRQADESEEFVGLVWDSIAATGSKHLQAEGMEVRDMSIPTEISQGTKLIRGPVSRSNIAAVFVNQVREAIGTKDSATLTPGGRSVKFLSSQRLELDYDGGSQTSLIREDPKVKASTEIGRWSVGKVVKNKVATPLGSFKLPIYVRAGYPHPVFEGQETRFGIDVDQALFDYYTNAHFLMPDKTPVVSSSGAFYELHKDIAPDEKKFYAKRWPEMLNKYPRLRTLVYENTEQESEE